jgi:membrane fusion protein
MTSLYRPEAIEGRRQQWLGEVRLARPLPLTVLTALVLLSATLVALWLVRGEYTRKAHVSGVLVPDRGLIRLLAPQSATVVERHVREGQSVRAGDELFVLAIDRASRGGDEQQRVQRGLALRQRSLEEAVRAQQGLALDQMAALARRLDELQRERAQLDAEAELQQQRLVLAQAALARLESLNNEQFVSPAQVQAKKEEVLGLQVQQKGLERQRANLAREAATLEGQRRETPALSQSRVAELQRQMAELSQDAAQSEARRELVVRAPQDGVVSAVIAEIGQPVGPDSALASLLPADALLQAQLFAPSSAVGFVRENQVVQLRIAAYPYQKFGHQSGRVVRVSRTPFPAAEMAGLSLAPRAGEPMYRITVALDRDHVVAYGQAQPLTAGMQLDADVLLDRRRLIEWLFEPVLGLVGRV